MEHPIQLIASWFTVYSGIILRNDNAKHQNKLKAISFFPMCGLTDATEASFR